MLDMPISELRDWRKVLKGSEDTRHEEKLAQALQDPGLQSGLVSNGSVDCRGGCTRLFYTGMPPFNLLCPHLCNDKGSDTADKHTTEWMDVQNMQWMSNARSASVDQLTSRLQLATWSESQSR